MHTARLPTVCRCFGSHQMSVLVGGGLYSEVQLTTSLNRIPVMTTRCHKQGPGAKGGLMSEGLGKGHKIPMSGVGAWTLSCNASWVMVTLGPSPPEQNDRQNDRHL